jgi:hypothetical protein
LVAGLASPDLPQGSAVRTTSTSVSRGSFRDRCDQRSCHRPPRNRRRSDCAGPSPQCRLGRSICGGTHAHNTLSADNTDVQVFYPFHPLHGVTLRILRRPKRGDGAVCVVDPAGRRLKIPIWMLLPECAEITISQRPHLGKQALLSLASLIASQLDSPCPR